jgi:structural maintenance of chromosome 1
MAERGHSCEVQAKLILEDGKELLVSRTLDAKDQQTYRIDGESYPREAYESFLMRCNINHRTVNYAIWQGEIDKLLLKDPKDLTAYFENLCGSSYFRQEQQEVQEEMTELENKIQSKSGRLVKMRQDKKSLKNLSNFKAAKEKIYEEYESINKKLQLLKAYLSEKGLKDLEKQLQARESEERQQIKTIN